MPKQTNDSDMSDLEREFELGMEEEPTHEKELERQFEALREIDERPEEQFEEVEEESADDYADRFYELSQKSFESESEVDDPVNGLMTEIERDFFWKGLRKKLKKAGKGLLKKGLKLVKGLPAFQAVKGITQLARGNLKGMLGSLAKAGLSAGISAIPGGAAILPALKALGFEATEQEPDEQKAAWRNFVTVSKEAFDYLAENLTETSDDPPEASRLAARAFEAGYEKVRAKAGALHPPDRLTRVLRVRKGERIRLVIEGT